MKGGSLLLIGGIGVAAYLTRDSWLPAIEGASAATGATGATGNSPTAPTTSPTNQPISSAIPGAVPLGTEGCYEYSTGTAGSTVINCPPGVSPPGPSAPTNNCAAGFTLDAGGVCTLYSDAYLLANINTIPWTGLSDIPAEQIQRIDPQVLSMYTTLTGINAGTVLAYMLGLGANPTDGTLENGSDGNVYQALNGVFYRQGTSSQSTTNTPPNTSTLNGVGRMGRLGRLGTAADVTSALPISNATLIMASADPQVAALVGRNPRAMLSANQWNGYYTQATGIVQGIPLNPADDSLALMSAEQYQARRKAAGLQTVTNLGSIGTIRRARKGAFPLGGLGDIIQWIPPGNRNIFQIPGRGAVPAGRGGAVPPMRGLGAVVSAQRMGLIQSGGGNHRWARSPFPRPAWWRTTN